MNELISIQLVPSKNIFFSKIQTFDKQCILLCTSYMRNLGAKKCRFPVHLLKIFFSVDMYFIFINTFLLINCPRIFTNCWSSDKGQPSHSSRTSCRFNFSFSLNIPISRNKKEAFCISSNIQQNRPTLSYTV